jgi:hypothetical protein
MAKKQPVDMSDIFAKTTPSPEANSEGQKGQAIGIYLKPPELAALTKIAGDLGIKRGALLTLAVRYFIREYQAGKLPVETVTHKKLIL